MVCTRPFYAAIVIESPSVLLQVDLSPGSLPIQILKGIYLGLLTGLLPAMIALAMGFLFKYVTKISIPAFGVVVLAVALAGMNGGLLAVIDPKVQESANAPTLVTALLVVMMLALYGHGKGDAAATAFPRRLSLDSLRATRLSADVVQFVGGRGEVAIAVAEVDDADGYPPLSESLRAEILAETWQFSADLPLGELESRVAESLRSQFDLADVTVRVDEGGNATVTAAPPASGVSRRVPAGKRAVSVSTLLPSGIARGDDVQVHTDEGVVSGRVVSAGTVTGDDSDDPPELVTAGGTTTGGESRVTVVVTREDAETLLRADSARTVVTARGTEREYELVGILRRAGQQIRRVTITADGTLVGSSVGSVGTALGGLDDERDGGTPPTEAADEVKAGHPTGTAIESEGEGRRRRIAVLARRTAGSWQFDPNPDDELLAGDELFVVGDRPTIKRLAEVAT